MDTLEFAADYAIEGNTLSGVVHVFGTRTKAPKGGVYHRFSADSMAASLPDAIAYYAHDTSKPLAKPVLSVEGNKLRFSMELGDQSYARDLRENQRMGLMREMSFGVSTATAKWQDTRERDGTITRDYTRADVYDISPVTVGAFPETSGLLHSADAGPSRRVVMARARARVLGGQK